MYETRTSAALLDAADWHFISLPPTLFVMPKARETCTRCSMRRQKCDRTLPCRRCVAAGVASSCTLTWKDGYDPFVHRQYPNVKIRLRQPSADSNITLLRHGHRSPADTVDWAANGEVEVVQLADMPDVGGGPTPLPRDETATDATEAMNVSDRSSEIESLQSPLLTHRVFSSSSITTSISSAGTTGPSVFLCSGKNSDRPSKHPGLFSCALWISAGRLYFLQYCVHLSLALTRPRQMRGAILRWRRNTWEGSGLMPA